MPDPHLRGGGGTGQRVFDEAQGRPTLLLLLMWPPLIELLPDRDLTVGPSSQSVNPQWGGVVSPLVCVLHLPAVSSQPWSLGPRLCFCVDSFGGWACWLIDCLAD